MVNIDEKELIKYMDEKIVTDKAVTILTTMTALMSNDLSRIIQVIRKDKNCIYCIGECNKEINCEKCLLNYYQNLANMIVDNFDINKNV